MPASDPASNAVKHGLSSKKYLPDHALIEISGFEQELIALHQPETDDESQLVRELSIAYWQKQENDRVHSIMVEKENRFSSDIFEQQQLLKFHQDQAQWRKCPQFGRDILARTYLGAQFFHQIWSDIASSLCTDIPEMTLDQAWDAALTEKSFANIQKINQDGWWIFIRFLASSSSSDDEIKDWILRSGACSTLSADRQVRQQLYKAPDAETSQKELLKKAVERAQEWAEIADFLMIQHEEEKALFKETAVGMGLGDEKLMAASKLALRYRVSAQSLVDKLQRRLDALRKGRELQRYRVMRAAERETQRQQKLNDRRYSQSGINLWEADQSIMHGPIPSAYESSRNRAVYETGIATEIDAETDQTDIPQTLSVQSFVDPEQNENQEQESRGDEFQTWPDSDFTDPHIERARRVMSRITDKHEAEQYCERFLAEKVRRQRI